MWCVVTLQTAKSKYFVHDSPLLSYTKFPKGLEEGVRIISVSFSLWNPNYSALHFDDTFETALSEARLNFIEILQPEGESLLQYLEN